MSNLDTLKKLKVKSGFSYHEEQIDSNEVMFGWKPISLDSIEAPFIVTYGSKAKSVSEEDATWSKEAGVNAASLSDYLRYFRSLTGDSAEDFYDKWKDNLSDLEAIRASSNPKYRDGEGSFLVSLANLLVNGEKFTRYGRIFKVIE